MAAKYKQAGFNLYIGLWQGPTENQLAALKAAEMPVVCEQNEVGLKHKDDSTIVGWMHNDEPDNAQETKDANGKRTWGPCIPPSQIVDRYNAMKAADPARPVMLNLGQGVANDKWIGRGNGAKLDDYLTYVKGGDIVSFDVYPVAGLEDPSSIGLVAKGIDRLRGWGAKRIWNCLECTAISGKSKATPEQVKAEAWSAIIHGSRGLIYFVHQFSPKFDEHALVDDPAMLKAVTALNRQIRSYGAALFRHTGVPLPIEADGARVDACVVVDKSPYVFAVNLEPHSVSIRTRLPFANLRWTEIVQNGPDKEVNGQELARTFQPYEVQIYRASRR